MCDYCNAQETIRHFRLERKHKNFIAEIGKIGKNIGGNEEVAKTIST